MPYFSFYLKNYYWGFYDLTEKKDVQGNKRIFKYGYYKGKRGYI